MCSLICSTKKCDVNVIPISLSSALCLALIVKYWHMNVSVRVYVCVTVTTYCEYDKHYTCKHLHVSSVTAIMSAC